LQELRIPTRRIGVVVFTTDGLRAEGSMFHTELPHQHGGPVDIAVELNDERAFVPFSTGDTRLGSALLNKRHIIRVHLPELTAAELPEAEIEELEHASVCVLRLDDDSELSGKLLQESPAAASRLVDKFNHAPTFLPFVTDIGLDFVNSQHIVRISRLP
jgi:hypothetical protein